MGAEVGLQGRVLQEKEEGRGGIRTGLSSAATSQLARASSHLGLEMRVLQALASA